MKVLLKLVYHAWIKCKIDQLTRFLFILLKAMVIFWPDEYQSPATKQVHPIIDMMIDLALQDNADFPKVMMMSFRDLRIPRHGWKGLGCRYVPAAWPDWQS